MFGTQIIPAGGGGGSGFIPWENDSWIVVQTTDDPVVNGTNLRAAYAAAAALTPNGLPLAADNRAVCVVPPGVYDLGDCSADGALPLVDYVDLSGLTNDRESQWIKGVTPNPSGAIVSGAGANNGLYTVSNVTIQNTSSTRSSFDSTDSSCYAPYSNGPDVLVNVWLNDNGGSSFSSTLQINYAGTYTNVLGGDGLFGGYGGSASGVFKDCTGGDSAFGGGPAAGAQGVASGVFLNCIATDNGFGGDGTAGQSTGRFTNCENTQSSGFSCPVGGVRGIATDCRLAGPWSKLVDGIVFGCVNTNASPSGIAMLGLPTADPGTPGELYTTAGVLMISP